MNTLELISENHAAKLGLKKSTLLFLTASLTVNVVLSLTLLFKNHSVTTVLLPMSTLTSEKPMTLTSDTLSKEYLSLVARDFLALATNNTPENVDFNRKMLLQFVHPTAFGEMEVSLKEQALELKRLRASTYFVIETMDINPQKLSVIFEGIRLHYIGQKETQRQRKRLVMKMQNIAGRLYLSSLYEVNLSGRASHDAPVQKAL